MKFQVFGRIRFFCGVVGGEGKGFVRLVCSLVFFNSSIPE